MGTSETQQISAMEAQPQPEHRWLQQFVGEWQVEGEATMEPGQPPERYQSTEIVRSIGALWIVAEQQSKMPDGTPVVMLTTIGYDPEKGRYVGTFVASMMSQLWIYEGRLDAAQRMLTLDTEGPNMMLDGKLGRFRDILTLEDADHRSQVSEMLGDDGQWLQIMTARYRRTG